MTDQTKHNIEMLHTSNKSRKHERDKVQNEMDDAMEALSVLDSAIACGFLKDKHSLIAQEWCKEYQKDIINNFLVGNIVRVYWSMEGHTLSNDHGFIPSICIKGKLENIKNWYRVLI